MHLDVATFLSHLSDAEVLTGALPLPLLIVLADLIHFVHFLHHHKDCRKCGNSYRDSCGNKSFLPPATKLGQSYIFTGVCDSVHRGDVHGRGGVHGPGGHA